LSAIVSFLLFLTGPHEPRAADPMTAATTSPLHQWIESLRPPVDVDSYWASIHANALERTAGAARSRAPSPTLLRRPRNAAVACASAGQVANTLRRYTPTPCPVHGRPDVRARASWVETQATVVPMAVLRVDPAEIVDASLRWHEGNHTPKSRFQRRLVSTPDFWRTVLAPHAPVTACGCRRSRTDCGSRSTVFGIISRSIRPHTARIHAANVRLDVGAPCGDRTIRSAAPPHAGAGR
jgi:hypothetical protein